MPSLASLYDGTETLSDLPGGLTVTLKKYLSEADFRAAQDALISNRRYSEVAGAAAQIVGGFDVASYHEVLVTKSIESWNLESENGTPLPVNAVNVGALPNPIYKRILSRVLELNKEEEESAAEAVEFRN